MFTCQKCGRGSKGGEITYHCACGWHSKIQAARCYGCGVRIVLGNPAPVEVTIARSPRTLPGIGRGTGYDRFGATA